MAPEGGAIAGTVVREFRSEEWGELYGKRVEEMIGVLKARNVPVFWVGLPSVRGARATAEMVYLNDIYRGARREGRHHLCRHLGRLRRRRRQLTTITARTSKARRGACAPATACISPAPVRASSRTMSSANCAA